MADINVGQFSEALNNKADRDLNNTQPVVFDYVVAYKAPTSSDPSWYRKYKSGWVEQGGLYPGGSVNNPVINFPITMLDTNYYVNCVNVLDTRSTNNYMGHCIKTRSTASMTLESSYNVSYPMIWEVKGMAAQS